MKRIRSLRVGVGLVALFMLPAMTACHSLSTDASPDPSAPAAHGSSATTTAETMHVGADPGGVGHGTPLAPKPGHALAAFAGGCFWGTEDVFRHVPGVTATAVGYTGGHTQNPTYEDVCSHTTGHAEAVLIEFDPQKVTYARLLDVFFEAHDPTTVNRQGPDVGSNYRSEVFTFDDAQVKAAHDAIARDQPKQDKPIVTEIAPIAQFWVAEDYHQQYDEKSGRHSCPLPASLRQTM